MAQGRVSYARIFARHGVPAQISRMPDVSADITVLRRYAEEDPVAHEISQQDTRFTLEWQQLNDAAFPLPVVKGDRILLGGEYFTVRLVRPLETHGELVGYEVRTVGG